MKEVSGKPLSVEYINEYPKFWQSIRYSTLAVKHRTEQLERYIERFETLYPMTNYPEIFFTVGALKSAGVYVHNYALIGIELAIGNTETDVSEFSGKRLSDRFENQNADNFLYVAIHELVHTQQKQEGLTLLGQSLCEGACDFIAELVMDTTLQLTHLKYGRIHEEEIKAKFKNEMFRTSFDGWLYSGNSSQAVSDLGYFMGYVICKSYYNKNKNKHRAIRDIIQLRYSDKHEIKKFLRQSGYRF